MEAREGWRRTGGKGFSLPLGVEARWHCYFPVPSSAVRMDRFGVGVEIVMEINSESDVLDVSRAGGREEQVGKFGE